MSNILKLYIKDILGDIYWKNSLEIKNIRKNGDYIYIELQRKLPSFDNRTSKGKIDILENNEYVRYIVSINPKKLKKGITVIPAKIIEKFLLSQTK